MPLNPMLEKLLSQEYAPNERYDTEHLGKDISYVTNKLGEPVTLFIGKRLENGNISGERYVRTIVRKPGTMDIVKSHWELKGKVAR